MPDDRPAAPGDVNPGTPNPQPQGDPGAREPAQRTPEQDARLQTENGEQQRADGDTATETAGERTQEGDPGTQQVTDQKPPKKSRYQRRIETLAAERDAAIRRADYYQGQAAKGGQARELDPLAFKSDADYQRALIKQSSQETRAEFARSEAQAAAQQATIVEQQIWDERVSEYEEAVPDFRTVAYSPGVTYSQHGLQMVRNLEEGPRVAYWLGKNPVEAQRIAGLPPLQTAFELGRLAQRLTGPPKKAVSQTPNPVPTVRGRAAATGYRPDSSDMDAYHSWRDNLN